MPKTILIVEDNDLNLKLMNDILQAGDYQTIQTKSGEEAVVLARTRDPDLVLMDIRLPDLSGLEAAKRIKEGADTCRIPVIAVTALAMNGDEAKIQETGCDGYIAKPFATRTLLDTVARFLK